MPAERETREVSTAVEPAVRYAVARIYRGGQGETMGRSLRLEPDVARQLVAECDRLIDRLNQHMQDAGRLAQISGFGDIPSAQQLQAGFARKAVVGEASVVERIRQFRDQVMLIRANFEAGGDAFLKAEESNAHALRQSGADL